MAKKYLREEIISNRRLGLRFFDLAVTKSGRQAVILKAIENHKEFPNIVHTGGWENFSWAFANAVAEILGEKKDYPQSYNLDEALTSDEIELVRLECNFFPYLPETKRIIIDN